MLWNGLKMNPHIFFNFRHKVVLGSFKIWTALPLLNAVCSKTFSNVQQRRRWVAFRLNFIYD